ncbi:MAG: U32 family peptidase [Spirochaetales bacterium]|nr:U32 family peptidase [Spirochaetales bacterium]
MELLSPAGNLDKLKYAYLYGADAAYIGIRNFSLRQKADNFHQDEFNEVKKLKGNKKLFGALNIYFHQRDIENLKNNIDYLKEYPFDAFIISDIGVVPILKGHFPDTPLHLSTQANCVNGSAARMYRDMGFSRVILGRETPLAEIASIKESVPDLEIETFVHGAMCLAYSGRCFISRYMADRSANQGACSHSCRWNYRVLEEAERPGEYYPVYEGDGFTSILSSKDLCMIDYLLDLKKAGIDSLKIEGRMKSLYYTAVITRAYRKHLDAVEGFSNVSEKELEEYKEELLKVSHREFSTGFYFDKEDIEAPTTKSYERTTVFLGTLGEPAENGAFHLEVKNKIVCGEELEFIGPDILYIKDCDYKIYDKHGLSVNEADHGKEYTIKTDKPLKTGYILRRKVRGLEK